MLKLRPYKPCDAEIIAGWLTSEDTYLKWGGDRFGAFPVTASMIDEKYRVANGDCVEPDNFYPWTAVDETNRPVGHFIMRYTDGDPGQLRFGWVIIDDSMRGKGYGREMLTLGLRYAFAILHVRRVTIGVFENNTAGHRCYLNTGFTDVTTSTDSHWPVVEMEITAEAYKSDPAVQ